MNVTNSAKTKNSARRLIPLMLTMSLFALIFVVSPGCRPRGPTPGPAALSLKKRIQSNLDLYIPELSQCVHKGNRKKTKRLLDTFYAQLNGQDNNSPFSLALLDSHGVTLTSRTQDPLSGSQNYGNYQVVLNVLQKKRIFTSSLYLQGGGKFFIICVPLSVSAKPAGVIVIGIDSEFLRQSGISESQFMSLDFNQLSYGTP